MPVFDILLNEHRLIRRYLDNAQVVLDLISENKLPDKKFFELGLEFSRLFSDKYHHYKEEYELFMLLAMKKEGKIDGQITSLRDQHERARNFTSEISNSIEGYSKGEERHIYKIAEYLGYYIVMLRQHINREDHTFYPLAKAALSDDEIKDIEGAFDRADKKFGADFFDKNESMVKKMEAVLLKQFGDDYTQKIQKSPKAHG